ncbi:cytochrome P450 [Streptomyces sp. PTM05]|uniref:Cytochrome P450 n=1 Tax=Streptantibioticus parmotrematis TaxID=2873249 RepID=A0ABS7QSA2_9ACTN|nr:cytochrome P450 [Streptantibioticus parmotrematis]MBY8886074.1 cytochrome P450 [Streptantibioticus parmotrematis]
MTSSPRDPGPAVAAPGGLPGLGHLPALAADPLGCLRRLRGYGGLVVIRVGTVPVHVLNAPELVYQVLVAQADGFDKGRLFERARPVLGDGLLASGGELHRRQRRLLQPAFHRRCVPSWARVTQAETRAMCAAWRPGDTVDLVAWTRTLATRVVLRALFTSEPDERIVARVDRALPVLLRGFVPRLLRPGGPVGRVPTPGSVRFDRAARGLRAAIDDIIRSYRAHSPTTPAHDGCGTANTAGRGGLLALLCGSGGEHDDMTARQVRDEAVTMLLAGVETTGASLAWLLHELHRDPAILARVRGETDACGGEVAGTRESAPYLHEVLRENLRLHTPTWVLTRRTTRPFRCGDARIPTGAEILFSPLAMHTDPRWYPRPRVFDPGRWTRGTAPPRGAFTPFGAGVHKCIGENFAWTETAVACAVICSSWDLRATGGAAPRPGKYLGTHQPRRLLMTVEPRQRQT